MHIRRHQLQIFLIPPHLALIYVQDAGDRPQLNLGDSFAFCKSWETLAPAGNGGRGNDRAHKAATIVVITESRVGEKKTGLFIVQVLLVWILEFTWFDCIFKDGSWLDALSTKIVKITWILSSFSPFENDRFQLHFWSLGHFWWHAPGISANTLIINQRNGNQKVIRLNGGG